MNRGNVILRELTILFSYDIFLSFRGTETRHNFTNHLYKALIDANIDTFLDDHEIEFGEDLRPEMEKAIKASRASVIVFSPNYASSRWCLNELVLILEQHRNSNHIIIPVFYHVDPTDIKKLQGSFGDAMAIYKQRMESETNPEKRNQLEQKMEQWKEALVAVADWEGHNVSGWHETELIDSIITDIQHKLGVLLRCNRPELTGMEDDIEFISSWLKDGSGHKADILTIWGMGGSGKTSLAKLIFGLHCCLFQRSSFIEDINGKCPDACDKLLDLQKKLCCDISKTSSFKVHDVFVYASKIEKALACKKVFIVLDNVDSLEQLYALLGKRGFHAGSKIILTTQDASLPKKLKLCNSSAEPKHTMHLVEGLNDGLSLQLLNSKAFVCNSGTVKEGYEEVSKKLVKYCQGNPFALDVIGSSLCNKGVAYWEEYIQGLDKELESRIGKRLRKSFESLQSKNDQELLKHIACFFVGKDRVFTETILKACDILTLNGIENLIDKCFVTIGPRNELKMHPLLQDIGRQVVHQESPDKPWKRSRLWRPEDSFKVLKQKKGKGSLKGIILDMRMLEKDKIYGSLELDTDALSKMDNLTLLQVNYVKFNGSYNKFPKSIRWLCMHGFPLKYIPPDLPMGNLVVLDLSYSNIESFEVAGSNLESVDMSCGSDIQQPSKKIKLSDQGLLKSLKILNLSNCDQLRSIKGLFRLPALERLILRGCISLIEICETIEKCKELVVIDLTKCVMFRKLPRNLFKLKKLETVSLDSGFPIEMRDTDLHNRVYMDSQASSSVTLPTELQSSS